MLLAFERIAVLYFLGLMVLAVFAPGPWRKRGLVIAGGGVTVALVIGAALWSPALVRMSLPHVYLPLGYWLPALLAEPPRSATRFEQWLLRTDAVLRPRLPNLPTSVVHLVELAYLFCYPLVPVAFALVWIVGTTEQVQRFWTSVLVSGYCCYGTLPWLVGRPPRLLETTAQASTGIRGLNLTVLERVSHQLNTFPSGHVAVSAAAALSAAPIAPAAGALLGLAAAAIAVGAVAGRYHYVVDVVIGLAVSLGAVIFARLID